MYLRGSIDDSDRRVEYYFSIVYASFSVIGDCDGSWLLNIRIFRSDLLARPLDLLVSVGSRAR